MGSSGESDSMRVTRRGSGLPRVRSKTGPDTISLKKRLSRGLGAGIETKKTGGVILRQPCETFRKSWKLLGKGRGGGLRTSGLLLATGWLNEHI